MNINYMDLAVLLLLLFLISCIIGWFTAKIIISKRKKKLVKEAIEIIEGKKENFILIDGVKHPAEKFKVKDEEGKEFLIDLKGGTIKQDEKKERPSRKKEIIRQNNSIVGKNSRGTRKKKRNPRARSGGGRIRRFG